MKCPNCGKTMTKRKERHHYTASGLDNVYIDTHVYRCDCGESIVDVPHVDGLHELIAKTLVRQDSALSGREFRFLRKQLNLKAKDIAALLGVSKVTVSRWETGEEKIGAANDRLIRLTYIQKVQEKCSQTIPIVNRLKNIQRTYKREEILIPREKIREATCHF